MSKSNNLTIGQLREMIKGWDDSTMIDIYVSGCHFDNYELQIKPTEIGYVTLRVVGYWDKYK